MTTQSNNILLVLANAVNNFNGTILDNKKHAITLLEALQVKEQTNKEFALSIAHLNICADDAQFFALPDDFTAHICAEAHIFISSLRFLAGTDLKRHSRGSDRDRTKVQEFLKLANQMQAKIENDAHDAEMLAIAQHPAIAPKVACCAKKRELINELADCNEARFYKICNESEAMGYNNELATWSLQTDEVRAAFGNYSAYYNFISTRFYSSWIESDLEKALRDAAYRLDLFFMYNENGEFMYRASKETEGYSPFIVRDTIIGWVLDEQPTPTTKPRELVELDNCLNAQIAASRTLVAVANNCKEFANVTNAAAAKGIDVSDYLDLCGDAGWELDFNPMQLEQIQSIYAAAKEQDGDDDDKTSADELVEQFAKFIHKQLFEKRNAFDKLIDSSDCEVSVFAYDLMINKSIKILLQVKGSGNVCLKHLCAGVNNGSVCSVSFCIHQCQFFKTFYCFKMERFFKDILQNNL